MSTPRASLASRLRSRSTVFGAWTSLAHPSITEIFAGAGVNFVGIDLEHNTISTLTTGSAPSRQMKLDWTDT